MYLKKFRQDLVDYMAIISENLDETYADVSNTSTIPLPREALDNAMQYVASSNPDSTNEVHLQTLHEIADPLEQIIAKEHPSRGEYNYVIGERTFSLVLLNRIIPSSLTKAFRAWKRL